MNLSVAEELAVSLIKKHGIWESGWRFKFNNHLKAFGVCSYGDKTIQLSKRITELNDLEDVKDTILHEIAHAIAGFKAHHGHTWKMVCIHIGAKPERCYDSDNIKTPELKYFAVCGGCGETYEKARIKLKEVKRACKCQSHKNWDDKILLEFKTRY